MSWPYTPSECPRCRYFDGLEPPVRDDGGYELVGVCGHPRIAMELFRMRERAEPEHCPCFLGHDPPGSPGPSGLR